MSLFENDPKPPKTNKDINICIKRCVYYHNCLSLGSVDKITECEEKVKKCIKSFCYLNTTQKHWYKISLRDIFKI